MDAVGLNIGGGYLQTTAQVDQANAQVVAVGSTAAATAAFTTGATVVSLRANVGCWYRVAGTAAANTAGSDFLPANLAWMLKIPAGATISFIQATVGGYVAVTPMAGNMSLAAPTPGPGPVTAPTWNPADKSATVTLSNGNLTATCASGNDVGARATKGYATGKVFWEINVGAGTWGADHGYGLANIGAAFGSLASTATGGVLCYEADLWFAGARRGTNVCAGNFASNITIMVAVDLTNKLWWTQASNNVNQWNVWSGPGTADPASGTGGLSYAAAGLDATLYPVATFSNNADNPFTLNTVGPFVLTPPSGFTAIGTL